MRVNSICILGGGTSGFATASVFARYKELSGLDFNIRVIHSEEIGTVGVGESTIFSIRELFYYLGLKDKDWMPQCNATYKTSVRFENFYKQGRYFYYPFGPGDLSANEIDWWINKELYPDVFTPERASLYFSPQSMLNEENRLADDYVENNAAYHFDSHLMGEFFKKYCEERGVEIINDTYLGGARVKDANAERYGDLESIGCENGAYAADLFVDCTGFKSLLLGDQMGEKYISFSDTLINNKALVAKVPYVDKDKQLKNYTNSVALKNGWIWETPLWDCMAYGYVHTNKFATEEEIEQEFFEHVGQVDYKTVHFKTGRRERAWVRNVVAVGLSYGFLEPLEATGIATTIENCFRLLEALSKRDMNVTQIDKDIFNSAVEKRVDGYRYFIERHYYFSSRDDSRYWRYLTEDITYYHAENFLRRMVRDKIIGEVYYDDKGQECLSGDLYVIAGMNHTPFSKAFTLYNNKKNEKASVDFKLGIKRSQEYARQLPSSYRYLRDRYKEWK